MAFRSAVEPKRGTARELIGSPVINAGEETLGAIDDAIFDADGKLTGVVVSFGGFRQLHNASLTRLAEQSFVDGLNDILL